jgi:hypothetical protein
MVTLAVMTTSTTGCSWLVNQAQNSITAHQVPIELVTLTTNLDGVTFCIDHPGGFCPTPKESPSPVPQILPPVPQVDAVCRVLKSEGVQPTPAVAAICDPTATALDQIRSLAGGQTLKDPSGQPIKQPKVSIGRVQARVFAKNLFDATNIGDWTRVTQTLGVKLDALKPARLTPSDADYPHAQALKTAIAYTSTAGAYLSAYFENGHFVSLTIDPSALKASAESELENKLHLPSDSAKAAVEDLLKQIDPKAVGSDGQYHILTAANDGGFFTRGGDPYAFPSIAISITPVGAHPVSVTKVDFSAIASDLIRVYIEAVGDVWGQLPGVTKSTGVQVKLLRAYGLGPTKEQVNADQFKKVNDWSSKAETAAAAGTGQLIRGIAWLSLNNEALAKIIETAAGVAVRKATEKVTWCVEACAPPNERLLFHAGGGEVTTTRVSITE